MIFELEQFWEKHHCTILPAFDMEVGAGTMAPYTFFESCRVELQTFAMYSLQEDQQMVVMLKIRIVYTSTCRCR
jgi:glycyl-tRNA synthetase alpha subunit